MLRNNRLYGLMAGITAGLAVWGAVPLQHDQNLKYEQTLWETDASVTAEAEKQDEFPLKIYAQSAVLMDGDTGRILLGKNENEFRPMASTTKIMTCILALELAEPDKICTFSSKAAAQPKVHLGAQTGTQFYLKDLLYSLMLESHNDTAVAVAENVAGSVEDFAKLMNRKAKAIGCENTSFLTPNGLDAEYTLEDGSLITHGTTAADLARIMKYCIMDSPQKEKFLSITQTSDYFFSDVSGKSCYSCYNHNALLREKRGMLSGKTGFTGGAGYSYVGACENEGRTYILTLLGCGWPPHKTWKWADAKALLQYGEEHYHYREIYQEQKMSTVPVKNGIQPELQPVISLKENEKKRKLLLSDKDEIKIRTEIPKELLAPVRQGQKIGAIIYRLNGKEFWEIPVYSDREIKKRNLLYYLKKIFQQMIL